MKKDIVLVNGIGYVSAAKLAESLAESLGVTVRTLQSWQRAGTGPTITKIGQRCHYPDYNLKIWAINQEVKVGEKPRKTTKIIDPKTDLIKT